MRWALRIWGQGIRIGFVSAMTYRADFFLNMVIAMAGNLVAPMITLIIYGSGAAYPGWTVYEALLLQGIFTMCMGLCSLLFFSIVWDVMYRIKDGTYDLVMLKPGPAVLHSLAGAFNLEGVGLIAGGLLLFIYALVHLSARGPVGWLAFGLLFVMGTAVVLGCVLMMAATAFKWVGNSRISEIFNSAANFGKYPLSIFPRAVSAVISFIVPVAMIGALPAQALLGRLSPAMLAAAVPCALFLCLGARLFGHMVRLYQSAGG